MVFLPSFVNSLLDKATEISCYYLNQNIEIERKGDNSPVTIADREIEAFWRDKITQIYPHHQIFGEEYGNQNKDSQYCWLLDPIDGTRNFVTKNPLFGNLMALLKDGAAVAGAINLPMLNQRYFIGLEGTPLLNEEPLQVRHSKVYLNEAFVGCTTPDMFTMPDRQKFLNFTDNVAERRYGGDCFSYCQLAMGGLDLVIEAGLYPYDYAPAVALINRLGGQVTDWQGHPIDFTEGQHHLIASFDASLHQQAVNALSSN